MGMEMKVSRYFDEQKDVNVSSSTNPGKTYFTENIIQIE
jgi:hypothetical protein